ncbi:hypothetical protein GALL_299500 [mine drainage metagenome]|uniref:YqjK-like protein n=1 Tax=mine drainage metagenome TaxID=410659 RepID=A0A1J5QY22_9ZZZZ
MNDKLQRLAERRERLVAQALAQRVTLAQNIEPWRLPLARADQGLAALRFIKRHPALIAGGSVMLVVLQPSHLWKWLRRGWVTWWIMHDLRDR